MDQAEYDLKFRRQGIIVGDEAAPADLDQQPIVVDGQSVAPLRITMVNSTPQAMNDKMHEQLKEQVEVVGRIDGPGGGVEVVRRLGGEGHNDAWARLMRRCGRLR